MTRAPDLAFEALAEATSTDWNAGRGELNAALRSIREQTTHLVDEELADEISQRAVLYRRMFPEITLTPTALAKHWLRVFEEQKRMSAVATNQSAAITDCTTCGGHQWVVVSTRPAPTTHWMIQHGYKGRGEIEEYAPCPDCSTVTVTYRRYDGSWLRTPDPEKVKEMMRS